MESRGVLVPLVVRSGLFAGRRSCRRIMQSERKAGVPLTCSVYTVEAAIVFAWVKGVCLS